MASFASGQELLHDRVVKDLPAVEVYRLGHNILDEEQALVVLKIVWVVHESTQDGSNRDSASIGSKKVPPVTLLFVGVDGQMLNEV